MREKILIVGATGNIGSALVRELCIRNATVIAAVRESAETGRTAGLGVPVLPFDFDKPQSMKAAFAQIDRAFLLLPLSEKMLAFGMAAVDAAKEAGLTYLVRTSELGADANSPRLALQVQGTVDRYLQDSGIPCTILRPNFFMQNFATHYAQMIRERGRIFLPQSNGKISFIDVRDIASVAAAVLLAPDTHTAKGYDLTGPRALSNQDVARHLSNTTGKTVQYHAASDDEAIAAMLSRGVPQWISQFVMSLHQHVREGQMANISSAVHDIIGRDPMDFEQFAENYAPTWTIATDASSLR